MADKRKSRPCPAFARIFQWLDRRLIIRVLLVIFMLLPAAALLTSHPLSGPHGFLIGGTLAFVLLVDRTVLVRMPEPGRYARGKLGL